MIPAAFIASYLTARTADQGLANFAGLVTLRHGTNPVSWIAIHVLGAMPAMGGSEIGGDYGHGYHNQNRGRFYFANDSDYHWHGSISQRKYVMRKLPRDYAACSTAHMVNALVGTRFAGDEIPFWIIGLLIPTIKFRASPQQVERLYGDPTHNPGVACSTDEWWSPLNIGLVGTIYNSLTYMTPVHMIQNPLRVISGVALLAISSAVAYYAMLTLPAFIAAHKTAIIAGAFFAVI